MLCSSRVSVMKPAEMRDRNDIALLNGARLRRVAVQRQVRTRLVVVGRVATEDTDQMTFAEGDVGEASLRRALRVSQALHEQNRGACRTGDLV